MELDREIAEVYMKLDYEKDSKERIPLEHYLDLYQKADVDEVCTRLQLPYDAAKGCFQVNLLGTTYEISYPGYEVGHVEDTYGCYPFETAANARILLLRYLLEGQVAPPTGDFCTYKEMPWGDVYMKQFHGRCILRFAYGFGNKLQDFENAMEKLKGVKVPLGDCAYEIEFLKGLFLRFILWEGDDEFPPSAQILFSDNFPVAFHIEDMAVVGDIVIGMMKELSK
jgi:hypothetical protein